MFKAALPVLRVSSMRHVERFYCAALSFTIVSTYQPSKLHPDPAYRVLARDGAVIHVSSFPGDGVVGGVVTIMVDDIEALHRELVAYGIDTGNGIMNQDWGDREVYVRDPDGNAIRFQAAP